MKSIAFDLGDTQTSLESAPVVLLFDCGQPLADMGTSAGPGALLPMFAHLELFETQVGSLPLGTPVYAEATTSEEEWQRIPERSLQLRAMGKIPLVLSPYRRCVPVAAEDTLVALWGKLGREECDESALLTRPTLAAGIRAASTKAFQAVPENVTLITAKDVRADPAAWSDAVSAVQTPIHLSIDLDVLAPGVLRDSRSVEPGGLDWYDVVAASDAVFATGKVASIDISGMATITPHSAAAWLCAQLVLRTATAAHAQQTTAMGDAP